MDQEKEDNSSGTQFPISSEEPAEMQVNEISSESTGQDQVPTPTEDIVEQSITPNQGYELEQTPMEEQVEYHDENHSSVSKQPSEESIEQQQEVSSEHQNFDNQHQSDSNELAIENSPEEQTESVSAPKQSAIEEMDVQSESDEKQNSLESIASFFQISPTVLNSLDDNIVLKLSLKMEEFHDLESASSLTEMNFEQFKHSSSKKMESLARELTQLKAKSETFSDKESSLISEINNYKLEIENLKQSLHKQQQSTEETTARIQNLHSEKSSVYDMLSKKQNEVIHLNKEIDRLASVNKDQLTNYRQIESVEQNLLAETSKLNLVNAKLQQEITLVKQTSSWYEEELQKKANELKELRDLRRNQVGELEANLDKYQQEAQIYKSKSENLTKQLNDVNSKYDQTLTNVKKLNDKVILQQESFAKEMATKNRLLDVLMKADKHSKDRVNVLEAALTSTKDEVAKETAELKLHLDDTTQKLISSEANAKRLEETITNLTQNGNMTTTMYGDNSNILGDLDASVAPDASILFTPMAQRIAKNMGEGGVSLSQLYSDFQSLKKKYLFEKHQKETIQRELNGFIEEFERKAPILEATNQKCKILETELSEISQILESSGKEKETILNENRILQKRAKEYEMVIRSLEKKNTDFRRQVTTLLTEITLREKGESPLTEKEKKELHHLVQHSSYKNPGGTDTDELISSRLVVFKNVVELVNTNEELLSATRALGEKLEEEEHYRDQKVSELEASVVDDAKRAIIELKDQLEHTEAQLKSVTAHRDMLQNQVDGNKAQEKKSIDSKNTVSNDVLRAVKEEFEYYRDESKTTIKKLEQEISDLQNEKYNLSIELARAKSTAELNEERHKSATDLLQYSKTENNELRENFARTQANLSRLEADSKKYMDELIDAKSAKHTLEIQIRAFESEKAMLKSIEERLRNENNDLIEEKSRLNTTVLNLRANEQDQQEKFKDSINRFKKDISDLQDELSSTRSKLEASNDEVKRILTSKNADSRIYQQRIDSLNAEVKTLTDSINEKTLSVEKLTSEVHNLTTNLEELRNRKNTSSVTSSIVASTGDVATLKEELNNVLQDLELANNSAATFEKISKSTEKTLNSLTESYEEFKQRSQESLDESKKEIDTLTTSLEEARAEAASSKGELDALKATYSEKTAENSREINELKTKVSIAESTTSDLSERLSSARDELHEKSEILSRVQSDYEGKVDELNRALSEQDRLTSEVQQCKEKIQELEGLLSDARSSLIVAEEGFNSEKTLLEDELRAKRSKLDDLESQNRTLMNQLEQSSSTMFENLGEDQAVKDFVTYLQRTKDSLEQQLDLSKSEEKRLRQSLSMNEDELVEVKTELAKAQEQIAQINKSSDLQTEIKEKLHELELFRENNRSLRDENVALTFKFENLTSEYNALKENIDPLKQKVKELTTDAEIKQNEVDLVKGQVDYWKKRADEILTNISASQGDNQTELLQQIENLKASEAAVSEKCATFERKYNNLRTEAQTKLDQRKVAMQKIVKEKNELTEQLNALKEGAATSNPETEQRLTKELETATKELNEAKSTIEKLKFDYSIQSNKFSSEISSLKTTISKLNEDLTAAKKADAEEQAKLIEKLKEDLAKSKSNSELPPSSAELEEYKAKLEEESNRKLEEHKSRIRAPTNARIAEVIEQRWKKRSAELEKEYEDKMKELGNSSNGTGNSVDTESLTKELKEKLEKEFKEKFEVERQNLKAEITAAVRKENEFKETIMKRRLASLQEQLQKQNASATNNTSAPATAPATAPEPLVGTSAPLSISTPLGKSPAVFSLPSKPLTVDNIPSKRPAEDQTESNEDKKPRPNSS